MLSREKHISAATGNAPAMATIARVERTDEDEKSFTQKAPNGVVKTKKDVECFGDL